MYGALVVTLAMVLRLINCRFIIIIIIITFSLESEGMYEGSACRGPITDLCWGGGRFHSLLTRHEEACRALIVTRLI